MHHNTAFCFILKPNFLQDLLKNKPQFSLLWRKCPKSMGLWPHSIKGRKNTAWDHWFLGHILELSCVSVGPCSNQYGLFTYIRLFLLDISLKLKINYFWKNFYQNYIKIHVHWLCFYFHCFATQAKYKNIKTQPN